MTNTPIINNNLSVAMVKINEWFLKSQSKYFYAIFNEMNDNKVEANKSS